MIRTRVGYAGGTTASATYENIGDHAEAIEIDFDPEVIAYRDLLDLFLLGSHAYRGYPGGQYRSAIWTRDGGQATAVQEAVLRHEKERGERVLSEIAPLSSFTLAEDYHQKYVLRRHPALLAEFTRMYTDPGAFLASTAVTRANAFLGGNFTQDRLREDLPRMGLSAEAIERVQAC